MNNGQTLTSIREIIRIIKSTEKVNSNGKVGIVITVDICLIKDTVMEKCIGKMEHGIKVIGLMECSMDKDQFYSQMEK